jgi:uncharacterized protein DUF481
MCLLALAANHPAMGAEEAAANDTPAAPAAKDATAPADAAAPAGGETKPPARWSNSTELSLVVTEGNSSVQTFGLKNSLEYRAKQGRARFRIDALRSDTSDDPFLLVTPGLTFQPGETPAGVSTMEVRPGTEPDVARFFGEGRYEGDIWKKFTWNAGASWETNEDAGIVSRSIVFAGLGRAWRDRDDLKFRTNYGLSYTDRIEDVEDPEKDQRFMGARLTSYFMDTWGKGTTYDNDFTLNISLKDISDFYADLTQGLTVSMSKRLGLKVSLQLTYANEPALEEVDVIARVILVDPDGIPGNGDEFFQTVDSSGSELTLGEDTIRKEKLDSTFRTSLQITF